MTSFAAKHQRIKPYTPKHNGKVERYPQTLANEVLRAGTWHNEDHRRDQLPPGLIHYNYHRPHSAAGDRPPASRLKARVTNVMTSHN